MTTTDTLRVQVGEHGIGIAHPDKLLFPDDGITKNDLVDYYHRIADWMLPHLEGRALVMELAPEGLAGEWFIQKVLPDSFPDWVATARLEHDDAVVTYVVCDQVATLVFLAGQACVTPNVWLSRVDDPGHPDQIVFDLDVGNDPTAAPFAAGVLRALLEEVGLAAYAKSTGSQGLHVHVPLDASADFDAVQGFASDVADLAAARHPDRITTAQRKVARRNRLFVDVSRNAYGQHVAAPYAVRLRPGATVAVPLEWDEATDPTFDPRAHDVTNVFRLVTHRDDPWAGWSQDARPLDEPRQRLDRLVESGTS